MRGQNSTTARGRLTSLAQPRTTVADVTQPAAEPRPRNQVRSAFASTGAVHFSTRGEYGVRLMVQLARRYGQGPASLAEVAGDEDLPRPYLEQLVSSLRAADLVVSTRGARGGYQLSREPAAIRMGTVLRALEGPIAPMVCVSEDPAHAGLCARTSFCTVNLLWLKVREAISRALDSMTLADLAVPRLAHEAPPGTARATAHDPAILTSRPGRVPAATR